MPEFRDLQIIVGSRMPIVVIETYEEPRAVQLVSRVGIDQDRPVFTWTITEGLKRADLEHNVPQRLTIEPDAALGQIKATERPSIYVLCDFHPFLDEVPKNIRLLKEIAMEHDANGHTVILLSHALSIPLRLNGTVLECRCHCRMISK